MNKHLSLIIVLCFSIIGFAQDPVFNQTDNSRNYLNPAFIGTEKSFSADLSYRNQWPELAGNYTATAFLVNQYLGKGNGVSIHFVNDNAANIVKKNEFGIGYAKCFNFKGHHSLSIGMQASYFQKSLNLDDLTFGNMIDPRRGFVYQNPDPMLLEPNVGIDFNAGVLYYNSYFFAGYAAKHITEPKESFFGNDSRLPMRHGIQVGGHMLWNEIVFTPSVSLFQQADFQTIFAALKVRFNFIEVDAGVQFDNGIFGGVGFRSGHFNIGYNYTKSVNNISSSASTHEIRMGCDFVLFKKENEHFFYF